MTVKQLYCEFKRMGLENCEISVYDDEKDENYEITEASLLERMYSSGKGAAIIMINDTDFPSDEEDLY